MLAFTLATLGACTGDDSSAPLDEPPLPSARRTSSEMGESDASAAPACMTRWRYPALGITFDCRTSFVGGDRRHYVTTCPVPVTPRTWSHPPDRDEVELDAAHRVVRERLTFQVPPGGSHPFEDIATVYDAAGRMQETTMSDDAGNVLSHSVVTERAPDGQPTRSESTHEPIVVYHPYPTTTQTITTLGYDRLGRLQRVQARFPLANSTLYYDRSIQYDDLARRRAYMTIIDLHEVAPELGGRATNTAYDLLDRQGRVLEFGNEPEKYFVDYRYDARGRLVSEVRTGDNEESIVISYLYDCR